MTDSQGATPLLSDARHQVTFFYSSHCSACTHTLPFIRNLSASYPGVRFVYYNTAAGGDVYRLYLDFGEAYGHPHPSIPVVFAGDSVVLIGHAAIVANLTDVVKALESGAIPSREYERRWMDPLYVDTDEHPSGTLTLPLIITAGLLDGINPCAFAVLVFLLVALLDMGSRRKIFIVGTVYSLAVFTIYFLSGLGIFAAVHAFEVAALFSVIAGAVAIIAGILQIASVLVRGMDSRLAIPEMGRRMMTPLFRRATLPAAFLLGLLVGIFELPCTGGIYIAILALLSDQTTFIEGIPLLLLYNGLFVLPLLVITAIVGMGIPPERIDSWRLEHRRLLRVMLGLFLVMIGIFTLTTGL
jgi:cytochrome c biogenesis protein CcdA